MGVVEDRVLDRSDAGTSAMRVTMPAEHHEVGPGRVAGQHPCGVPVNDIAAHVHGRVLVVPPGQGRRELPVGLGRDTRRVVRWQPGSRISRGARRGRDPVPGVDGNQVGAAQRGLLERERQRSAGVVRVADADSDLALLKTSSGFGSSVAKLRSRAVTCRCSASMKW